MDRLVKWLPGFLIAYVREERYCDDGTVVNTYDDDVAQANMKRVIIPKKRWKLFDSCCYSAFTDNLPVEDNVKEAYTSDDLKVYDKTLLSFREWTEGEFIESPEVPKVDEVKVD